MRNFQDTFERRKQSFISAFSVCMTVPLRAEEWELFSHKIYYCILFFELYIIKLFVLITCGVHYTKINTTS